MFAATRPGAYRQPAGATASDHVPIRSTTAPDVGLGQLLDLAQDMLCVAGFDGYFKALFRERANQALAVARRLQTRVGVALADVDQFKEINDRFGHPGRR